MSAAQPFGESPREKWASYIGLFSTIIPALIVSGFMPDWNVLPFEGWLAIASGGAAVAGAIATPRYLRGALAGAITGAGMLLGIVAYVAARSALTDYNTYFSIELVIGVMIGGAPGMILFSKWARDPAPEPAGPIIG